MEQPIRRTSQRPFPPSFPILRTVLLAGLLFALPLNPAPSVRLLSAQESSPLPPDQAPPAAGTLRFSSTGTPGTPAASGLSGRRPCPCPQQPPGRQPRILPRLPRILPRAG